jgi:hypothetical protein
MTLKLFMVYQEIDYYHHEAPRLVLCGVTKLLVSLLARSIDMRRTSHYTEEMSCGAVDLETGSAVAC